MKMLRTSIGLLILLSMNNLYLLDAQPVFTVKPLSFNSRYTEFSPQYWDKGFVFCSNFENHAYVLSDKGMQIPLTNIYYVSVNGKKISKPGLFSQQITTKFHDGPLCFDQVHHELFITRNISNGDSISERKNLGIFVISYMDTVFGAPQPMPFNSQQYSFGHPTISADGKTLIFISDKPGGLGGTDLYKCQRADSGWSDPETLGDIINSTGNEMFPFLCPDGTLYFASDGKGGNGGLDIFRSHMGNNGFSTPELLPKPINSDADDFGLITDQAGIKGYFSSNRSGSDDLFSFAPAWPKFKKCAAAAKNNLCYTFTEENQFPDDTLSFVYKWHFGDGKTAKGMTAEHCYATPGRYEVVLDLVDTIIHETVEHVNAYELFIESLNGLIIDGRDSLAIQESTHFSTPHKKAVGTDWFYWDMGDGNRYLGPEVDHQYTKKGSYHMTLGRQYYSPEGKRLQQCAVKTVHVQ